MLSNETDRSATRARTRYSSTAQALHWIIAVLILLNLLMGWRMSLMHGLPQFRVFQLHKSFGITVLLLSLARLAWRLAHRPPAAPPGINRIERVAAALAHWTFYGLMIGLPLSGWALVSVSETNLPTLLYGVLPWPFLPVLHTLGTAERHQIDLGAGWVHYWLGWSAFALIVLHVAGALKHQRHPEERVLPRMVPMLRRTRAGAPLAASFAILATIAGAGILGLRALTGPVATVAHPTQASTDQIASDWTVDTASSTLGFHATVNGETITGHFAAWTAAIRFDLVRLDQARVQVLIDTGSAQTGDGTRDDMLPAADWFDHTAFPQAEFRTDHIVALGAGRYQADGTLCIRDKTVPIRLAFSLSIDGDLARMTGPLPIDRTAFGIGQGQFGGTDTVAATVTVDVTLIARRRH